MSAARELSKKLAAAKKSSKKGSDSKSNNDGPLSGEEEARIVGQQGEKLAGLSKLEQSKPARKTPGVTRLLNILVQHEFISAPAKEHLMPSPKELIDASRRYLQRPPEHDNVEVTAEKIKKAKGRLATAIEAHGKYKVVSMKALADARKQLWKEARVVVTMVEEVAEVIRLRAMDLGGGAASVIELNEPVAAASIPHSFDYVVIDGAGLVTEPDALSCLRHAKVATLLVGDHAQLPPTVRAFTGGAASSSADAAAALSASLFARLTATRAKLGDYGGVSFTLNTQYSMPESIAGLLSAAFYKNRLRTGGDAAATDESEGGGAWEAATHHPMPAVLVDAQGNESRATARARLPARL